MMYGFIYATNIRPTKITVNTMDELYDWFMRNGGYDCSVIITNIWILTR